MTESVLKILKHRSSSTNAEGLSRNYRFYPLYLQVVLRAFGNQIYGLALPNYLIYQQHFSPSLVGIIYSIFTIAYIIGPIIARPITEKIGIRNALIIGAFIPVITVGIQLVFFIPWVLILCRTIEGLILGFFWPNVQMVVSNWQKVSTPKQGEHFFSVYGFSWNFGCLCGGITGFLIVFFSNNDFLSLIIGWVMLLSIIPFSLLTEHDHDSLGFEGNRAIAIINHVGTPVFGSKPMVTNSNTGEILSDTKSEINQKMRFSTILVTIPISVSVIAQMIHGATRAMYNFNFPILLYQAQWASYWTYFMLFSQQLTQMVGINLSSHLRERNKFIGFILGLTACILISSIILFNSQIVIVLICSILLGFFNGLIYAFGAQVMMSHGKVSGSLKYATLYEIFSGIGYGITPFIAGYIAEVSILANYTFIIIISIIALFFFIIACRKGYRQLNYSS